MNGCCMKSHSLVAFRPVPSKSLPGGKRKKQHLAHHDSTRPSFNDRDRAGHTTLPSDRSLIFSARHIIHAHLTIHQVSEERMDCKNVLSPSSSGRKHGCLRCSFGKPLRANWPQWYQYHTATANPFLCVDRLDSIPTTFDPCVVLFFLYTILTRITKPTHQPVFSWNIVAYTS
jgi:hypothetical protein